MREESLRYGLTAVVLLTVGPLSAQQPYAGPAVLSRGPVGNLARSSDLLVFQPSLQLLGIYESGLLTPSLDSSGQLAGNGPSFGATANVGLNGYHRFRRAIVGLNYGGSFRHYTRNPYLDGIDQSLALNVQRPLTARTTISVTGAGGTYSRAYALGGMEGNTLNYGDYSQGADPTLRAVPRFDLLDTRTYYVAGGGDLVYQRSPRLSFRAGGTATGIRRRVSGLVGLDSFNGRSDVMYGLSRNSTIGVDYSFDRFRFVRGFGSSDIHTSAVNYSVRFGRNWTLALRGGGYRLENLRAVPVALNPAVAAILGQGSFVEAFYSVSYGTVYGAGLSRNFRRSGISFRYDRGISAGNGVLLTSRNDSAGASYSYHGWRRWSLSLNANASRMTTTFQDQGSYNFYTAGVVTSYRIARYLHVVGNSAWRRYQLGELSKLRNSYLVSLGLGFAPGEVPLSLR